NNALGKGAVTLEDGSMLQAGAANLAVTNTLVLNGFETFDADGNHCLLSGVISGGGNLVVSDSLGGGSLTLSGNNSFTGGVEVQTTTLDLGGNGALGTGSLKLDAGATLRAGINSLVVTNTVDLAGNATYDLNGIDSLLSGAITGAGSLDLTGSGNVTLSGNNTYSGGTTLSSGGLWVSNPAALGQGSVVNTGGTLAAAGGPATLLVALDYTQGASGSLRMGLGGTAAGQYDVLSIGGAATLNGNLTVFSYNGFKVAQAQVFEIVDSTGSLSGEFSSFTDNAAGLGLTIVYGSNYVLLESLTQAFALAAATPNQVSVGVALDNTLDGSPFSPLSQALKSLGSASQQQAAMDQVSPASLTPMFQMGFSAAQARAQLVGAHLSQLFGSAAFNSNDYSWANQGVEFAGALDAGEEASLAQSATPGRWNAFVAGIGSFGTVGSDGNAGGYQYSVGGTAEGLEYRFGKDFVGGLLMGYSQSGTRQSTGTVNVSGGQVGLYVGVKQGDLNLEALVEGGLNNYSTQREGFGGTAVGSTQGQEYSGQLGGGYDFHMDGAVFGPLASVQTTRINVNGFTETGSLAPLTFGAQGETSIAGDLGAQASRRFNLDGLVLSPALNLAWEHIYQGNEDALAAGLGSGANFTVNGPATGTDAAVLGVGVRAEFAKGLSATVGYQGKLGLAHYDSQSFAGGVNIGF
ncbi:MAG TPA: autotransporter domain-containing protein, partial [bacterium]|nr:autotransporter domain-containing protein [bacterium]